MEDEGRLTNIVIPLLSTFVLASCFGQATPALESDPTFEPSIMPTQKPLLTETPAPVTQTDEIPPTPTLTATPEPTREPIPLPSIEEAIQIVINSDYTGAEPNPLYPVNSVDIYELFDHFAPIANKILLDENLKNDYQSAPWNFGYAKDGTDLTESVGKADNVAFNIIYYPDASPSKVYQQDGLVDDQGNFLSIPSLIVNSEGYAVNWDAFFEFVDTTSELLRDFNDLEPDHAGKFNDNLTSVNLMICGMTNEDCGFPEQPNLIDGQMEKPDVLFSFSQKQLPKAVIISPHPLTAFYNGEDHTLHALSQSWFLPTELNDAPDIFAIHGYSSPFVELWQALTTNPDEDVAQCFLNTSGQVEMSPRAIAEYRNNALGLAYGAAAMGLDHAEYTEILQKINAGIPYIENCSLQFPIFPPEMYAKLQDIEPFIIPADQWHMPGTK